MTFNAAELKRLYEAIPDRNTFLIPRREYTEFAAAITDAFPAILAHIEGLEKRVEELERAEQLLNRSEEG